MELIKVRIVNKGSGFAMGKNVEGEWVSIKNGDLIPHKEIEVVQIEKNEKFIVAEIVETFQNEMLLERKRDDEQLISTKDIIPISPSVFEIGNKWVFPHHRIRRVIDYILDTQHLWDNARLALVSGRPVVSAAFWFGIPFQKAIEKLHETGYAKARLYCPQRNDFSKDGVVAEMLANSYIEKDGTTTLEMWQGVEGTHQVHYAHGIMDRERKVFIHFDCAIIDYDITDKHALFSMNKKIKGGHYQKLFRIDSNTEISPSDVFELANKFFPLDHLIDEYFEIEKIA